MKIRLSMNVRVIATCVIAILLTAAAPPPEVLARFDQFLKDPRSAQIEIVETKATSALPNSETVVCGRYNAKNSYGAYTGFQPFVYRSGAGGVLYSDGVAVRSDGKNDSIEDIMANDPKTTAEMDALVRRGRTLLDEVKTAFALCGS